MKILAWYTLIITIICCMVAIAKDGSSTTEYTGIYKLISVLLNIPIIIFFVKYLF